MPQEDEKFLTEVFAQLTDDATEDSKRRELASFKKFFLFLLVFFLVFFGHMLKPQSSCLS